jgi:polysaccharide pyruvyl transferase WcaK-like protein
MKVLVDGLPENARIGIFGHYGNENLGDEAIIEAVMQNIRRRLPRSSITCFSMRPDDTALRYQVTAFPIRKTGIRNPATLRLYQPAAVQPSQDDQESLSNKKHRTYAARYKERIKRIPLLYCILKGGKNFAKKLMQLTAEVRFIARSFKILNDIDLLLITGSNQFLDNFGGPWAFPFTLLKWSILAKITGAKVYYISVGAGPINSRLSYYFIRWALMFSDYVSLRDDASKRLIEKTGFPGVISVYPDLAHSLDYKSAEAVKNTEALNESRLPVVGINPMPMYEPSYWCVADVQRYSGYLDRLATFCSKLLREEYPIFFFGTQRRDEDVIDDILNILVQRLGGAFAQMQIKRKSRSVEELMANLSCADIVVASRFHGTVLSLLAEKPVLAICYHRKARDLMREMDQEDYVLEFDTFTPEDLWERFKRLKKNRHMEVSKIRERNAIYRTVLDNQYDRLFTMRG